MLQTQLLKITKSVWTKCFIPKKATGKKFPYMKRRMKQMKQIILLNQ